TATSNTAGNGNIYISDSDNDVSGAPALVLAASAAGSGTAVDATTGNLQVTTSNGGICVAGNSTATTGITLNAHTNIVRNLNFSLTSPEISLTAVTGDIGSAGTTILFGNNGNDVLLYANATAGSLYIEDDSAETVTLSNATPLNAAGSFVLATSGSVRVSPLTPANTAITSPNISLNVFGGNITAAGSSIGSAVKINSGGSVNGLTLFISSTLGTIGGTVVL